MTDSTQTAPAASAEATYALTTVSGLPLDNPYWDEVKDSVSFDDWDKSLVVGSLVNRKPGDIDRYVGRTDYVTKYSWTITDPASVEFVHSHSKGFMIDPMAGSGYWSKLLIQLGTDVVSYDDHSWKRHTEHHHVLIPQGHAPSVVRQFPHHTLFLAWPPYAAAVGFETVRNYRRDLVPSQRIIYLGEGHSGCTGSDEMHEELDEHWDLIATHRPVQWFGMHDDIYVYDRKVS